MGYTASPRKMESSVIIGTEDGLYCISQENGKEIWYFDTNSTAYPSHVAGKKIYATSENICYCIDAENGKKIWTFNADGMITSQKNMDV